MLKLHAGTKPEDPNLRWEAYASWAHFSWLYLLSAVSALRSALFFKLGVEGWETWIMRGRNSSRLCRDTASLGPLRAYGRSSNGAKRLYGTRDSVHSLERRGACGHTTRDRCGFLRDRHGARSRSRQRPVAGTARRQ